MKNHIAAALICLLIPMLSSAQQNEISVRFIGNAGLHLTDGVLDIYVDFPYQSGAFNYMKYDASELDKISDSALFIFTHRHPDHYSKRLVKRYKGKIIGPWKVAKDRKADLARLAETYGLSVQAFKTGHSFSSKHSSYLITWHGKKIFISGDTGDTGPLSKLKGIDWVFAPYWIYSNAKAENLTIDARIRAIYHLYPHQKVDGTLPEDMRVLMKQGEVMVVQ